MSSTQERYLRPSKNCMKPNLKKKSKMPPEERARRRAVVGRWASEKIAKSEQLNFRIEEQSIRELQALAFERGLPVGTMIRYWVLERLISEKHGQPDQGAKALFVLECLHEKLNSFFQDLYSEQNEPQKRSASKRSSIEPPASTPKTTKSSTAKPKKKR